jgi:hypothetical protein
MPASLAEDKAAGLTVTAPLASMRSPTGAS